MWIKTNYMKSSPKGNFLFQQLFKLYLHWQKLCDNTGDIDSHYLLAFATLGDTTQIGLLLFLVKSPKVAKACTIMTVTCCCRKQFCFANLANVNDPLQFSVFSFIDKNAQAYS
jgi:hypothetical protein